MSSEAEPGQSAPLVVLSVEDDPLVAMGTNGTLEELGHVVIEASSGSHALAMLQSRQDVDLIVTDQGMPGMTGIEFASAARRLRPDLPIILVTGYFQMPHDDGMRLIVLQKPFRMENLADAISRATARAPGGRHTES